MVIVGIDAHKRSHTAVNEAGRKLGQHTTGTTSEEHLALLDWAEQFGDERLWAIEDCRHVSRRLERDLLGAGERIVRVPTKLMAHVRDAARSRGKSDPIDAAGRRESRTARARPADRAARPARDVRLLSDHRDHLVAERTRVINRLRWHLHELDPGNEPPARHLWRPKHLNQVAAQLAEFDGGSSGCTVRRPGTIARGTVNLLRGVDECPQARPSPCHVENVRPVCHNLVHPLHRRVPPKRGMAS